MQINAINNLGGTNFQSHYNKYKSNKHKEDRPKDLPQNNPEKQMRHSNAMRNYAMGTVTGLIGLSSLAGCTNDNEILINHKHNFNIECPVPTDRIRDTLYLKEYVPGETIYKTDTQYIDKPIYLPGDTITKTDTIYIDQPSGPDTVYVKVPEIVTDTIYKHDTIVVEKPIYIPGDTVYIKPNFDSEVADTINKNFGPIGIIPEGKGIPISMSFYHEYETTANRMLFNGRNSSVDQLVYDNTMTDWYGDKTFCRLKFSLNKRQGLIMQVENARNEHEKPDTQLDWIPFKTFVFKNAGNKLIKYEQQDDGSLKYIGTTTKGYDPQSVADKTLLPNGETETWQYSDWKVKNHDLKMDDLYNEYLDQLENNNND